MRYTWSYLKNVYNLISLMLVKKAQINLKKELLVKASVTKPIFNIIVFIIQHYFENLKVKTYEL